MFQLTIGKTELEERIQEAGADLPSALDAVFRLSNLDKSGHYHGTAKVVTLQVIAHYPQLDVVGPLPCLPTGLINYDPQDLKKGFVASQFQMYLSEKGAFSQNVDWSGYLKRAQIGRRQSTAFSPNKEISQLIHEMMLDHLVSGILPELQSQSFPTNVLVIAETPEIGKMALSWFDERLKKD